MMENSPAWKKRLSATQLEKKRLGDRANQRKARLKVKRTQVTLWQEFTQLLEKEDCHLLHHLVAENARLHEIHEYCQSKMESLVNWSQDCLDFANDPALCFAVTHMRFNEPAHPVWGAPESQIIVQDPTSSMTTDCCSKGTGACNGKHLINITLATKRPSIIFQIALTLRSQQVNIRPAGSVNDLVESIITWKISTDKSLEFGFLIPHLALDRAPTCITPEKVKLAIGLPDFYASIIHSLYNNAPIPIADSIESVKETLDSMPTLTQQRRSLAYLSYEHIKQFREYFRDLPEFLSQFWILYTCVTFLTFPTEKNLRNSPVWLWPTDTQFDHEHPGNLDYISWPMLREKLATTWRQYDLEHLTPFLVENFALADFHGKYGSRQIRLKANMSDLELDDDFRAGIFDLRNYQACEPLKQRYPELAGCFNTTTICWLENVEPLLNTAGSNDEIYSADVHSINAPGSCFMGFPEQDTSRFLMGESQRFQAGLPKEACAWPDVTEWFTNSMDCMMDSDPLATDLSLIDPALMSDTQAYMGLNDFDEEAM